MSSHCLRPPTLTALCEQAIAVESDEANISALKLELRGFCGASAGLLRFCHTVEFGCLHKDGPSAELKQETNK